VQFCDGRRYQAWARVTKPNTYRSQPLRTAVWGTVCPRFVPESADHGPRHRENNPHAHQDRAFNAVGDASGEDVPKVLANFVIGGSEVAPSVVEGERRACLPLRGSRGTPWRARLPNCITLTRKDAQSLHDDGLGAESGRPLDMSAVAELVCQSCGRITRSKVPRQANTMPACPCGGRRQIVRIRHRLYSGARLGDPTDERQR
jgi:hypothetical protein